MEEKKLTEKESIELITAMISSTKDRYIGNSKNMLMWGYLVVAVAIIVWIMLAITHNEEYNWLWFLIPVVGLTATVVMASKERRKNGVKTYSDRITSSMWTFVGVYELIAMLGCFCFAFFGTIQCWNMILAFTLVMVPFAEIVQGIIIREKSLMVGGGIGLAVGIVTTCCISGGVALDVNWYMPVFIMAFVAMMIVPGHILNSKPTAR